MQGLSSAARTVFPTEIPTIEDPKTVLQTHSFARLEQSIREGDSPSAIELSAFLASSLNRGGEKCWQKHGGKQGKASVRLPITGWCGPKILLAIRSIADRARFRIELGQRELQASALISASGGSSVIQLYYIAQLGSRDLSQPTGRQRLHAREAGRLTTFMHSFEKSNKCSFTARSFLSWKKERKGLIALKSL